MRSITTLKPAVPYRDAMKDALDTLLFDGDHLNIGATSSDSQTLPSEIKEGMGYTLLINGEPLNECPKENVLGAIVAIVSAHRGYFEHFMQCFEQRGIDTSKFAKAFQDHFEENRAQEAYVNRARERVAQR